MKALQRLNTLYFLVGYLGFIATWVCDLIASLLHPAGLATINDQLKGLLGLVSPHYCFARGVYDVQNTASQGGGGGIWERGESGRGGRGGVAASQQEAGNWGEVGGGRRSGGWYLGFSMFGSKDRADNRQEVCRWGR